MIIGTDDQLVASVGGDKDHPSIFTDSAGRWIHSSSSSSTSYLTLYAHWVSSVPSITTIPCSPAQQSPRTVRPSPLTASSRSRWSIDSCSLPAGLELDSVTGVISGTQYSAILLLWYLVLSRKSVTFFIRTADGFKPYKIRVRKNHPIHEDKKKTSTSRTDIDYQDNASMQNATVKLYVVWTQKTTVITLDVNGNTTAGTESVTVKYGESTVPVITSPQKPDTP